MFEREFSSWKDGNGIEGFAFGMGKSKVKLIPEGGVNVGTSYFVFSVIS